MAGVEVSAVLEGIIEDNSGSFNIVILGVSNL